MTAAPAAKQMTVEEYLMMEDTSTEKHEFIDGIAYAKASADFPHNQITSNAFIAIGFFLRDKPWRIYGSDLKVNVKTKSNFAYPDLSIICNGAQFFEGRRGIVTNPSVIIEVLSPDTERYDRGKKFMLYRQIETMQEYILISSMEMSVEKFTKTSTDAWMMKEYTKPGEVITIDSVNQQILLAELYRDVIFEKSDDDDAIV